MASHGEGVCEDFNLELSSENWRAICLLYCTDVDAGVAVVRNVS